MAEFALSIHLDYALSTNELAFLDGEMSEISVDSWQDIISVISRIFVDEKDSCAPQDPHPIHPMLPPAKMPPSFDVAISDKSGLDQSALPLSLLIM